MGLGVGVMVGIEERTKIHPAPDPPDEEQPADGATIVCSESPHPQSSHMSEFSDQQSLSSASGNTTARKLSQVPEEVEDYLSSGVVCCDSKDDLSTARSRASTPRHLVTEEKTGDGKDEVNEEEAVTSEGPNKSGDSVPSHGGLPVAYSEETKRYENQPTPKANCIAPRPKDFYKTMEMTPHSKRKSAVGQRPRSPHNLRTTDPLVIKMKIISMTSPLEDMMMKE